MSGRKTDLKMILSLILSIIIAGAVLFIAAEADHECAGDDCLVCCAVEGLNDLLGSSDGGASFTGAVPVVFSVMLAVMLLNYFEPALKNDPVELGVRLRN